MRTRQGFTLIELMAAMAVFLIVLAGAMRFVTAQQKMFTRGADAMGVLQNLSFGADNLDSQLRTTGANARDDQPPVAYASSNTFAFNADYVSNDPADISAVYIDPDAPATQVEGLRLANQIVIPGSLPNVSYPLMNYVDAAGIISPAELIALFFTPDTSTTRADDFVLMRQVNNQAPEVLMRNVLPDSTNLPFFRYQKLRVPGVNQSPTLTMVPPAELPMSHPLAAHGGTPDLVTRIDSLRAVLVSYVVTNGLSGTAERRERVSVTIPLPNMGLRSLKICGGEPILGTALATLWDSTGGSDEIRLSWVRAFDESQGENDVVRYVIWRRKTTEGWSDPLTSITASGVVAYLYTDSQTLERGVTYEYQLAAQDCSPKLSVPVTSQVSIPMY